MSGEPIISPFQEFLMRRKAWEYYAFSTLIILFGVLLDYVFPQGNWTPRFGAIVAGLVAFCYFSDLRQHESWWRWFWSERSREIEEAEEPLRDARGEEKLLKARGHPETAAKVREGAWKATRPTVKKINSDYWKSWRENRKAIHAQGVCIAFGTLIWAFGDIPVDVFVCGSIGCDR